MEIANIVMIGLAQLNKGGIGMAMYFLMYWHFIMMIVLVMIFSGIVGFRFPRFPFFIILIVNGIIGYVYGAIMHLQEIFYVFVMANVYMSIVPIIVIQWGIYMRGRADEVEMLTK